MTEENRSYSIYKSNLGPIGIYWNSKGLFEIIILPENSKKQNVSLPDPYKKLFDSFFTSHPQKYKIQLDILNKNITVDNIKFQFSDSPDSHIKIYYELLKVNSGSVISYGSLAEKAGYKNAARMAGTAMAKNPFPLIIPCHRVILSSGKIGNYSPGPEIKIKLLQQEGAL